ncbi:MAG: glycosyltransferase family 2 protein [Kiritimatiellae bacterium]|nr:glycosyltransferase family 2 protein [Kiritimatiellia bacterium]
MGKPFFSIVIVNFNHGRFLESAIQSILKQSCKKFELIVVDGGSSDNSVEVIKKYSAHISWWCSEKDKGQSDAFNKGFSHAKGKFGCWVNADDILMPGALESVENFLKKHPYAEWIGGSTVFVNAKMDVLWCSRCIRTTSNLLKQFSPVCVNGPSSFFSLLALNRVGGFDISLHFVMDIDLWRRFGQAGITLFHLKKYLWVFRIHEESKTAHRFITHSASADFQREREIIQNKFARTRFLIMLDQYGTRIIRLLSFTYLWSYIDTQRFKGKNIRNVSEKQN